MIIGAFSVVCSDKYQCCKPWQLVYQVDANGNRVFGNKQALLGAILAGARVRVGFLGFKYYAEADNAYVHAGHAHVELLQHVSKASWKTFDNDAYWWWNMVSTNGQRNVIRYNVGSTKNRGNSKYKEASIWYIKSASSPVYSDDKTGKVTKGSIQALKNSVLNGREIHVVTNGYYSFPLQTLNFDSSKVGGQSLNHISKTYPGNSISFQSNPYWWFTMISTGGKRDMSRWSVGSHEDRGHSVDLVDNQWFEDGCWEHVYTHDGNGKGLKGALKDLVAAVQSGRRIRFQIPGINHYTAEADNLSVRNGHVTAQALKHISQASLEKFQDNAYWWWLMLSSTGTVRMTRYNVGEFVNRGNTKNQYSIIWFAETRPWKLVYAHNANGGAISGSKMRVIEAIKRGASVRLVHQNGNYAFPAQNLAINNNEVAAQNVNHISMKTSNNNKEMEIKAVPYWWFTIVTTQGERDIARWIFGKHESPSPSHTNDRVGMKWYVQE